MWMINIIKIITGETAIKLLLIVMTERKRNCSFEKEFQRELKSEIKLIV